MSSDLLAAFPRHAFLDAEAARLLGESAHVVTLPAGTVVFRDGAECTSYLLVLEGSVRVQKTAENGREIVLYRVESGQSCVLTTNCLLAGEDYSAEAVAEGEVKALVLPRQAFRSLVDGSPAFREFVFSAYATRLSDLLALIEEVAFRRVDARLAAWLAGRGGAIAATHQEIAAELGTAREVVSRQLKDFERRGWVALQRGRIDLLDLPALRALAAVGD
ncbi:MAG: Crp/Fnr family transcriptional regulator [Magnetospirillum sp. WYHS-4]